MPVDAQGEISPRLARCRILHLAIRHVVNDGGRFQSQGGIPIRPAVPVPVSELADVKPVTMNGLIEAEVRRVGQDKGERLLWSGYLLALLNQLLRTTV